LLIAQCGPQCQINIARIVQHIVVINLRIEFMGLNIFLLIDIKSILKGIHRQDPRKW